MSSRRDSCTECGREGPWEIWQGSVIEHTEIADAQDVAYDWGPSRRAYWRGGHAGIGSFGKAVGITVGDEGLPVPVIQVEPDYLAHHALVESWIADRGSILDANGILDALTGGIRRRRYT